MGLRQIIYTSCTRGIQGVNDGQQSCSCAAGSGAVTGIIWPIWP